MDNLFREKGRNTNVDTDAVGFSPDSQSIVIMKGYYFDRLIYLINISDLCWVQAE